MNSPRARARPISPPDACVETRLVGEVVILENRHDEQVGFELGEGSDGDARRGRSVDSLHRVDSLRVRRHCRRSRRRPGVLLVRPRYAGLESTSLPGECHDPSTTRVLHAGRGACRRCSPAARRLTRSSGTTTRSPVYHSRRRRRSASRRCRCAPWWTCAAAPTTTPDFYCPAIEWDWGDGTDIGELRGLRPLRGRQEHDPAPLHAPSTPFSSPAPTACASA